MDIKIGDYTVLESGTIITIEDAPVVFSLHELTITFAFVSSEDKEMRVDKVANSKTSATFTFYNFNASLGSGNATPLIVGTLQGKELSVLLRFSQLDKGGKTVHYTWLIK